MQERFTISIFTENNIGLLHRLVTIFTRRHINIVSLTTSESEIQDIYRFIIVIDTTETEVQVLTKQLEKIIGVFKAFFLREEETVQQELALYKVSTANMVNGTLERLVRDNHARVLSIESDFIMIEKTGHPGETIELFRKLEPFGVMGFSRSGLIAISKKPLNVKAYVSGELA